MNRFIKKIHLILKIFDEIIALNEKMGYNIECVFLKGLFCMDIRCGDILTMKKNHPCGSNEMYVIRAGMDFKLRCVRCSREFMVPRNKIEKYIKKVARDETSGS